MPIPQLDYDPLRRRWVVYGAAKKEIAYFHENDNLGVEFLNNAIIPNNKTLRFRDSVGSPVDILTVNQLDNAFLKIPKDGKAFYIGRDTNNAEVAFFGGAVGSSGGIKELYIDSVGAVSSDTKCNSPFIQLRAGMWNGSANVFFNFGQKVQVDENGVTASQAAEVFLKFGVGSGINFIGLKQGAGPTYSVRFYQNINQGSGNVLANDSDINFHPSNYQGGAKLVKGVASANVSALALKNSAGTVIYIYPNPAGNGLVATTGAP